MLKKLILLLLIAGWSEWMYARNFYPSVINNSSVEEEFQSFNNIKFQDYKSFLSIFSDIEVNRFNNSEDTSRHYTRITISHTLLYQWRYLIFTFTVIFIGLFIYFIWWSNKQYHENKQIAHWTKNSFKDEKNLLRKLIDSIPDAIYIKDRNSRFLLANKQLAAIMHVDTPSALIGKWDFDHYPEEMASEFYNDEQEIISWNMGQY